MTKPILYCFSASSCSWRVRIALAHKKVDHEIRPIHFIQQENRNPEYLEKNPMGFLPALEVNGTVLAESMAILEYLEEAYPRTAALLPTDLIQRAQVRQICQLIISGIQPLQHRKVSGRARPDNPQEQKEWQAFYIKRGLTALEAILSKTSTNGKYCVGDSLTLADCCFVPQVHNAYHRFDNFIDMSPYPNVVEIFTNLYKLDAVKSCDPSHPL